MPSVLAKPSKLAIADSFSRAAEHYDQSAYLQRRIGTKLLSYLPDHLKLTHWLDLGCGTGYFTHHLTQKFPNSYGVGLDLAEAMLYQAKCHTHADAWVVGDGEHLPLQSNSIDLIYSNLAIQWCHDFDRVLQEAYRVLKPNGIMLFTSLCEGTLYELAHSWKAVDDYQHVNSFLPFSHYQQIIDHSDFQMIETCCQVEMCYYQSIKVLMKELKGIGAHNINPDRKAGLTTRKQWVTLLNAYDQFAVTQGLPATYQTLYSYLVKT